MSFKLYNSLTNQEEELVPREPGKVAMYNCGPTVYGPPHIGNFRSFIFADMLRRALEYLGYEVDQVMNITDVGHLTQDDIDEGEDKIQAEAKRQGKTPEAIAGYWTEIFLDLVEKLNLKKARVYPKATEHIPEMIETIEALFENGYAYEANGNIYFEVAKFDEYGKLSGNTLEQLRAGARIEVNEEKRHPADFALWKQDDEHLQQWDTPWGRGFPGWHVECSAMSKKHLGLPIDIHTGGEDNIFPHHEAEIAQAEGAFGGTFVKYWMHCRHLQVEGEKMSKSKGNFYSVQDILDKGYAPRVLRYTLMAPHYRQNMNFTFDGLDAARQSIARMENFLDFLSSASAETDCPEMPARNENVEAEFRTALENDLNISGALGAVFSWIGELNKLSLSPADARTAESILRGFDTVFGILDNGSTASGGPSDEEIEALIEERNAARANKDFATSDRIRDDLAAAGIVLKDTAEGTRWLREV
jgi:cysteinyl-tRNA synthetase